MPHSPVIGPLYTGRIIVRLSEAIEARIRDRALSLHAPDWTDLHDLAADLSAEEPELHAFVSALNLPMRRLVASRRVAEMLDLEDGARDRFTGLQSLSAYYVIDARGSVALLRTLLSDLLTLPQVRRAYRELHLIDPAGSGDYSGNQGYLDEAPLGIGARPLIDSGYSGAGVGFIDIEMMWNLSHEDLDDGTPAGKLIYNNNYYTDEPITCGYHGTSVLGIVIGLPKNGMGIDGIATGARPATLASRYVDMNDLWDVAGAIYKVLDPAISMPGDVMLIEVQTVSLYPVEIIEHLFVAIQVAVGNGIIVIAAAGNGNHDLNAVPNVAGDAFASSAGLIAGSLERSSPQFLDSGSILVGACMSAVSGSAPNQGHARWPKSNYGSRIDCHAWGENIPAPGDTGDATICDTRYNLAFGGTSGATAIIGGAALLLQDIAVKTLGARMSPGAMRARLSNATTGTPQDPADGTGRIAVMPNLMSGVVVPDIVVRDSVVDDGAVPNAAVSASPDIIVRAAIIPNPNATLGEASGTEGIVPANDAVVPNAVNYLYVRLQNRGLIDAIGATATVYWSDASSLVAPVDWHLIGTSAAIDVPAGGHLVVTAPIPWDTSAGNLPGTGHGCFVAVAHHPADPAPPAIVAYNPSTSAPTSWAEFRSYLGANNNIAWRNFTVLGASQADENGIVIGRFFIRGAPDEARRFDIEVLIDLPEHTRASLALPRALLSDSPFAGRLTQRDEVVELELNRHGKLSLPRVLLPRRTRIPCEMRIQRRDDRVDREYAIAVRQVWEGIEVGRVTWAIRQDR
jgi:serine protease